MNKLRQPDRIQAVVLAAGAALSLGALGFFLTSSLHLDRSDAFYYLSISDGYLESGTLANWTADPPEALRTPQNGVAGVFTLLSLLGFGPEGRLVALVILNYLLHLSTAVPLYRIARRVGFDGNLPIAALLAAQLCAFHVYRMQLVPENDGIFSALSLWLTWWMIASLDESPSRRPWRLAGMLALAATLVHFRLNVILIEGAAIGAALLTRRPRAAAWFGLLLAVSAVSTGVANALVDISRMAVERDLVFDGFFARLPAEIVELITLSIPDLLFDDLGQRGSLLYMPFALALALCAARGLRERESGLLFVALSCAAAVVFLTILPFGSHRYLRYSFPLFYLVILRIPATRTIGYLFVSALLVSSLLTFARGWEHQPTTRFWLHVHERDISLGGETTLLVTEAGYRFLRHPYFFLGAPSFRGELSWELILERGQVALLGTGPFLEQRLAQIGTWAQEAGYGFRRRVLTPHFEDAEGRALVELYDFRARR